MKIFAKVGKERLQVFPVASAAEFDRLGPPLRRGVPNFYDPEDPSRLWPEPADYVSIIREE